MLLFFVGCGTARFELKAAPEQPFDAVIVPGCPSQSDGSLTLCRDRFG